MTGLTAGGVTTRDVHGTIANRVSAGRRMLRLSAMGRVLTSLSAVAVAALAPAVARAGEYPIDFCKGWTNDAPAVQLPFAHSFPGGVNNDCSRGGPEGGLHGMIPGGIMQFDSHSVILLQVPADRPGIVIKRVASQYAAPGTSGSLAFVRVMAGGALLDNQVAPHAPSEDRLLPAGARDLSWGIYCSTSGSTYCYVPTAGDVFHVYKARLFLSESADPTVTVTGGSLIGGGPKAGPRTLLVDAFDGDSGILGMTVKLDDTVVGDIPYQCAYDDWSACRRDRQGQVLDIDTTKVFDGCTRCRLSSGMRRVTRRARNWARSGSRTARRRQRRGKPVLRAGGH